MNLEDLYRLLRSGHVQAQGIVDTLGEPLLVLDQTCCVVSGSRAFFEKFLLERDDTIGRSLFDVGGGQWDIPELRRLLSEVVPKLVAVIGYEVNAVFPPLGRRTMLVSARRLIHPDNISTNMLVTFDDVSDTRRVDAEKDILLAETRHRMKNLLGVVRAIATQTEVQGRSGQEYRDTFLGRFEAVLHAEDLSLASNEETDLAALIERALVPAGADRCHIVPGPSITLKAGQVVPISMILHELVTNASKYGALSARDGTVHVTWRVAAEAGRNALILDWREENGPPVTPPTQSGFGTRLIEFSAERSLGGGAELTFEPAGLRVRVTAPLE
jgi:two-component sensor histidine kinase